MKRRVLSILALGVLLPLGALTQDAAKPLRTRQEAIGPQPFSRKAISFSGVVSDDGKFFLADPDSEVWTVTNPEVLQSHHGRRVALRAQTTSGANEIRVLCVKPGEAEPRAIARAGDAAFRR